MTQKSQKYQRNFEACNSMSTESKIFFIKMYLHELNNQDVLLHQSQKKTNHLFSLRLAIQKATVGKTINKSGHWSEKEQAKYYAFLEKFKDKFNEKESRRHWKVFKLMSQFIKTRDPNQCRSHHHKMNKNFTSIQETLEYLGKKNPHLLTRSAKYGKQLMKISDTTQKDELFSQTVNKNEDEIIQEEEINKQEHKYQSYFDKSKLNDIGNLRTDASCNIIPEQPLIDFSAAAFNPPQTSFKGFPTTGLLNSSLTSINQFMPPYIQNSDFQYQPYMMPYPYPQPIPQITQNQRQWLQCHQCFIKWITKLQNLI